MSESIYAKELLEKLTKEEELAILEIVWNNEFELEQKIDKIMKAD